MNTKKPLLNPALKLVLDLGPLLLFFLANSRPALFLPLVSPILPADIASGQRTGIFVATAVFMIAVVVALAVSYALTRHLPVMPLVTAVVVLVFGSLTLVLHDGQQCSITVIPPETPRHTALELLNVPGYDGFDRCGEWDNEGGHP